MRIKTIGLVPNPSKKEVVEKSLELTKWLRDRGIKVIMVDPDAKLVLKELAVSEHGLAEADLVVTLGGDGTVLRAIRLLRGESVSILAVNYGKIGFLAEIQPADLYSSLEKVFNDDYQVEKRLLLKGITESDGQRNKALALNDFIISGPFSYQLLHLDVYINGQFFYRYAADGLAVSSPTGSTAYSLSAGGPLVSPLTDVKMLTPVNPHTLFNRSIVVSANEEILIRPVKKEEKIFITADGIPVHQDKLKSITITSSKKTANLVRFGLPDFFKVLRKKVMELHPLE